MKLYLLRHGQTEANVAKIAQGHLPGKLTPLGESQAKKVAERLIKVKLDYIIVSDLNRTRQTAAPIIATHPEAKVIYEPRVRERNQGVFEGTPYGTFTEHVQKKGLDIVSFKPEGGESIALLHERSKAFFEELFNMYKGKTVLIVSHGGFLTQTFFHLLQKKNTHENYAALHPKNTALSLFNIKDDGNHEVELLNSIAHL